jgi:hypothetical protein
MRPLSNAALLEAWEAGLGQPHVERALSLLVAGVPDEPADALAALTIGERDERLLRLREATFGNRMPLVAACPQCGENLEAEVSANELVMKGAEDVPEAQTRVSVPHASFEIEVGGRTIRFRLPNSIDLAVVRGSADAERALFARCVGEEHEDDVMEAVAAKMAELDPQSDIDLSLACAACGHRWSAPFDIASYFWSEIDAWAQRLLLEIHELARGYGWSERDILAMSGPRRRAYLELLA